jgi:hypothetical protein
MRTQAIDRRAPPTRDRDMSGYLDPLTIVILGMLAVLALLRKQPDD